VRCGCAYEWGVHVAFFAQRVALTAEQVRATQHGNGDDPVWSAEERLLIRLVDELHDTSGISDGLWRELTAAFSVEQIFELIALVGFYHTASFFANGFRLARALRRTTPIGLTRAAYGFASVSGRRGSREDSAARRDG
jgi:alkylhydroperoxidase family enzyme